MDSKQMIGELLKSRKPEQLAIEMGKCVATLYLWKAGKRNMDKGDESLITKLYNESIKKSK